MEHFKRGVEFGVASFQRRHSLSCQTEEIRPVDAAIRRREKSRRRSTSSCHPAAEMPAMPEQAMEFLSRTWSPSSSDLFQILSPACSFNKSQLGSPSALEDCEPAVEVCRDEDKQHVDAVLPDPGRRQFNDETWEGAVVARGTTTPRSTAVQRRNKLSQPAWQLNAGHMRAIARGFLLRAVSVTGSQRRRRRDELRLHAAQAHAAVSVAQLAAAVAGTVSVCELRPPPAPGTGRGAAAAGGDRKTMGAVLASAAALVATVCAEAAAETAGGGANRARVASAVRAGRESRSPAELLALTATAATSLRGAAALRIRAADVRGIGDGNSVGSIRASIHKGTALRVCLPCGRVRVRTVAIFRQGGAVVLRLGKKLLRGTFATYKDYKVLAVVSGGGGEAVVDGRPLFPLALSTPGAATVQLLFEHQAQCKVWTASIEGMLSEQKLKCPINGWYQLYD
ncbi:unnamed protein product [Urochloa decumbens]|uniref:Uncharacterized protein n=1 Tax=Urochloa decumbens TaxID=240449 RepID=A0ABC8Z398_9POAL